MKTTLKVLAVLFFFFGIIIAVTSKSAIHDIHAALSIGFGSLTLASITIVNAVNRLGTLVAAAPAGAKE